MIFYCFRLGGWQYLQPKMPKIHTSHLVKLSLPDILIYFLGCHHLLGGKGPSHLTPFPPSLFPLTPLTPSHCLMSPPSMCEQGCFPVIPHSSHLVVSCSLLPPSHSPSSLLLPLAPLTSFGGKGPFHLTPFPPSLFPLTSLTPSCSSLAPLTPFCSSLAPLTPILSLAPTEVVETSRNSIICYYPSVTIGSERERGEQEGSEREQKGSEGSDREVRGSEGSKTNVILGFKAPTTIAGKKFGDHL